MASKIINITDRLTTVQPIIQIGDKEYTINNSMETVLKFEELAGGQGNAGMMDAIKAALGEKAYKEIKVEKMSVDNFKVLTIALLASMQGMTYEDAEARFQRQYTAIV